MRFAGRAGRTVIAAAMTARSAAFTASESVLGAMRTREIEAAHGKQAPPASSTDISEALVLIERGKAAAAQQWALRSGDAVETNAALRSIFTK